MSSYLPAGVTSRDIDRLCEHYREHPIFECMLCLTEFYENDDADMHMVNGATTCSACTGRCDSCGDWLDDERFPVKVIRIRFRDFTDNGKLSAFHCPTCAVNEVLGKFFDDHWFDAEETQWNGDWGKDAIAQLLAKAFPLPAKEMVDAA